MNHLSPQDLQTAVRLAETQRAREERAYCSSPAFRLALAAAPSDNAGAKMRQRFADAMGIMVTDPALDGMIAQAAEAGSEPTPTPDEAPDSSNAQVSSADKVRDDHAKRFGKTAVVPSAFQPRRDDREEDVGADAEDPNSAHGPTTRGPAREGQNAEGPPPRKPRK
jgi:hypothetical protein